MTTGNPTVDYGQIRHYAGDMKLILQTQLFPDAEAATRLKETMERFNEAANWLAGIAFDKKLKSTFDLHHACYYELREKFGLPADTACRCLARAIGAYKCAKTVRPKFRPHAAVPYSMNKNISFKGVDRVSIATLNGRVIVPFLMGQYQSNRFDVLKRGQSELILRKDKKWFLHIWVEIPNDPPIKPDDFIGVDFGVENIAVTSDGTVFSNANVERKRQAVTNRRRAIGKKTKGAKRRTRRACHKALRRLGSKEGLYRRDFNHQIAKQIVALAKGTRRGIAIEDLNGINRRIRFRKKQRARVGGWAFSQLRSFVVYKAALAGIPVVVIDPRNTSKTCHECGHCDKRNRQSQARFKCISCGHETLADLNAALNIRARGAVRHLEVAGKVAG